jgi:hypothetical protein
VSVFVPELFPISGSVRRSSPCQCCIMATKKPSSTPTSPSNSRSSSPRRQSRIRTRSRSLQREDESSPAFSLRVKIKIAWRAWVAAAMGCDIYDPRVGKVMATQSHPGSLIEIMMPDDPAIARQVETFRDVFAKGLVPAGLFNNEQFFSTEPVPSSTQF